MRRIKGKEHKYGISRKKKSKQPAKGMRTVGAEKCQGVQQYIPFLTH
jgi:hypothetical protein